MFLDKQYHLIQLKLWLIYPLIVVQNYFLNNIQIQIGKKLENIYLPLAMIFNLLTGDNNDEVFVVTGVKHVDRILFIVVTGFFIGELVLSSFCGRDKNDGEKLRLDIVDERSNNLFVGDDDDCKWWWWWWSSKLGIRGVDDWSIDEWLTSRDWAAAAARKNGWDRAAAAAIAACCIASCPWLGSTKYNNYETKQAD